jgi:hypothetical protein
MKVSRNELLQLCQKALQGLGFPAGGDKDAAQMVSWLDTHQLPGTRLLHNELPLLSATASQPATITDQSATKTILNGHGQSALLIAPNAIDMASANICATDDDQVTIVLSRCHSPLFAIALPLMRVTIPRCFHIHWQQKGQRYDFLADVEKRSFFYGDLNALLDDVICDLSVTCVRNNGSDLAAILRDERGSPTIDAAEFASRAQASLFHGIEVGDTAWNELVKLSRRILIAATPESRALGAGASSSDND